MADRLRGTSSKYDAVLDDAAKLEEMILGDFIATDEYRNLPPLDPHQAEFVREMTKRYNVHLISARFEADREFTIPNLRQVGIGQELVENRLHLVGDYPKVDFMREIADLSKWIFAFEDAPTHIRELLLALPEEGRVYVPKSQRVRNDLKSLGDIDRSFRVKINVFDSYQRLQHLVED